MRLKYPISLLAALLLIFTACTPTPETGPVEIRWDRDSCAHCRMVLSDPHYAAQIRYFPADQRSRIARFDDIGCALRWLEPSDWAQDPKTEIWVADYRNGQWLDARSASFVYRNATPMEYGLGAQSEPGSDTLDFAQAKRHIDHIAQQRHPAPETL